MSQNEESMLFDDFLKSLKDVNIYTAIQSVLDSLDIWLSCVKYYFEIAFPSYLKNDPDNLMKSWVSTSEGLFIFIAGGLFMALFSFMGNYNKPDEANSESDIKKMALNTADNSWPYFRDVFKGFKWTFKAMRNVLVVLGTLAGLGLVSYTNIVGVSFGIIAAINRLLYRNQIEHRKSLQKENDTIKKYAHILKAGLVEVNKQFLKKDFENLSNASRSLFEGTIFKIDGDFYTVSPDHEQNLVLKKLCVKNDQELNTLTELEISNEEMKLLQHIQQSTTYEPEELNSQTSPGKLTLDYLHCHRLIEQFQENKKDKYQNLQNIFEKKRALSDKLISTEDELFQHQKHSNWLFASALTSSCFNAPYFFLGLITTKTLMLAAENYVVLASICAVFMIINVISDLYQEYDYQRRLNVSAEKAKLASLSQLIALELEKINLVIEQHQFTDLDLLNQSYNNQEPSANFTPQLDALLDELQDFKTLKQLREKYLDTRQKLVELINLPESTLIWQGLRNGLQCYGIINGVMLIITSSIGPLYNWTFSANLFYANFILAAVCIAAMVAYTYVYGKPSDYADTADLEPNQEEQTFANTPVKQNYFIPKELETEISPEHSDLKKASKNLMVGEQCEIIRQSTSGFRKGIKFISTTAVLNLFSNPDNTIYYAVGFLYGVFFLMKGLRSMMQASDDVQYKKTFLLSPMYPEINEVKAELPHPSIKTSSSSMNLCISR